MSTVKRKVGRELVFWGKMQIMELQDAVKVLNRHHHRMEPHARLRWVAGDCGCRPAAFPLAFLKHDSKEEHDDFTLTPFEAIAIATAYKSGLKRKEVDDMREIS